MSKPVLPPNPTLIDIRQAWDSLGDVQLKFMPMRRIETTETAIAHGLSSIPIGWTPFNVGAVVPAFSRAADEKYIYATASSSGSYDIVVAY